MCNFLVALLAAVAASRVRVPADTETTILHIIISGLTAGVLTVLSVLALYKFFLVPLAL